MSTPELIATRFARCLDLFRDASAKEDQKTEFRALLGLLKDAAVTIKEDGGRVVVNGAPLEGTDVASLIQRIELHNISEIAVPRDPPASHLFELLKSLADQPGQDDVPTRLRNSGAEQISVTIAQLTASAAAPSAPPSQPTPPPSPALQPPSRAEVENPEPMVPRVSSSERTLGTDGILRGDAWGDIRSVPIKGVPLVTHDPPPPPEAVALPGSVAPPEPPAASLATASLHAPAAPAAPAAAAPAVTQPEDALLAPLERNPQAPNVGDVLSLLIGEVENALNGNRPEQAFRIVAGVVRNEQRVSEGSVRRHYGVALKRMFTKALLKKLADMASVPKHREEAILALGRSGADGAEVLLDLLVGAANMSERRAAFDALTHIKEGANQLVHLLGHPEWYVVRNMAELAGEMGLEEAVPGLAKQLEHRDDRVRKAVALALAKIGTRSAAEPLRRALRDKSPEVRIQVALGIGGKKSSPLAMPLVVALEEEKDEAVQRELILALGRIGSADAVQALIKVAQPSGILFGRKPSALRLAAVEALRLAATSAALGMLQGMSRDADKQVKAAAQSALADLKKKK